jgi:hypothetical protein
LTAYKKIHCWFPFKLKVFHISATILITIAEFINILECSFEYV